MADRLYTYKVTTKYADQAEKSIDLFRVQNVGWISKEKGKKLFVRRNQYGTRFYIEKSNEGISLVNKLKLNQFKTGQTPKQLFQPRMILPSKRSENTRWEQTLPIMLLHNNPVYSVQDPRKQSIKMQFSIISKGQPLTLSTKKRFDDCLHIEGYKQFSFFADPLIGHVDVPITQNEWYCRGVGLVKLVREEPLNLEIFRGGKQVLELIAFSSDDVDLTLP